MGLSSTIFSGSCFLLIQQLCRSAVCSGMIQCIPAMVVNNAHTCAVTLLCRNRCLLVSNTSLHSKHLKAMMIPLFFSASCGIHAFLATTKVKHFTLVETTLFQIALHGPVDLPLASLRPFLYYAFNSEKSIIVVPPMRLSGSSLVPGKFFIKDRSHDTHRFPSI